MRIALLEDDPPQPTLIAYWLEESALVHTLDGSAGHYPIHHGHLLTRQALLENVWHTSPEAV